MATKPKNVKNETSATAIAVVAPLPVETLEAQGVRYGRMGRQAEAGLLAFLKGKSKDEVSTIRLGVLIGYIADALADTEKGDDASLEKLARAIATGHGCEYSKELKEGKIRRTPEQETLYDSANSYWSRMQKKAERAAEALDGRTRAGKAGKPETGHDTDKPEARKMETMPASGVVLDDLTAPATIANAGQYKDGVHALKGKLASLNAACAHLKLTDEVRNLSAEITVKLNKLEGLLAQLALEERKAETK